MVPRAEAWEVFSAEAAKDAQRTQRMTKNKIGNAQRPLRDLGVLCAKRVIARGSRPQGWRRHEAAERIIEQFDQWREVSEPVQ